MLTIPPMLLGVVSSDGNSLMAAKHTAIISSSFAFNVYVFSMNVVICLNSSFLHAADKNPRIS